MSLSLLLPPTQSDPDRTAYLHTQASSYLKSQTTSLLSSLPYPLSLFINTESQTKWHAYENLLIASLIANDISTARSYLDAITARFGENNDRVRALSGLFMEASATSTGELDAVLRHYDDAIDKDGTAFSIYKRKAALQKSLGRTRDAVDTLTQLLDASPTDAEAWAELADLYFAAGAYEQAVFCLEEVLVCTPNAWNMHARLGEVLWVASRAEAADEVRRVTEGFRRFCRSVELCDDYLRGYYGLKLTSQRLVELLASGNKKQLQTTADELPLPSVESVKRLHELATNKLGEIVRRGTAKEKDWDGYSPAELQAARELLDKDTKSIQR